MTPTAKERGEDIGRIEMHCYFRAYIYIPLSNISVDTFCWFVLPVLTNQGAPIFADICSWIQWKHMLVAEIRIFQIRMHLSSSKLIHPYLQEVAFQSYVFRNIRFYNGCKVFTKKPFLRLLYFLSAI